MHKEFIKKVAALAALVGILAFFGIAFLQLQVAFGWTNPSVNPPGGGGALMVDSATGNVGIYTNTPTDTLTINGTISAMGNLVRGVSTPIAGTDAVNKDYLKAQIAGAGGGDSFIIYGTAARPGNNPTIPGGAVPACPTGYKDLLSSPDYSFGFNNPGPALAGGYGPLGTFWSWGFNRDRNTDGKVDWLQSLDPAEQTQVGALAATYSLCSSEPIHYIPGTMFGGANLPGSPPAYLAAAACTPDGAGNTICNTCRICGK